MNILAGTVRRINPGQSKTNCVNCVIATDAMLAGRPAAALPGGPHSITILEQIFGAKFSEAADDLGEVVQALLAAGSGSRGIVYGSRSGGVGHVFNAVNQNGVVRFLDGQIGKAAVVSGYTGFRFLRSN
ncbi:toxin glutamine deamidase domain-containing protein [Burkholderia sp. LMU1-1-1.1]|uniref:toxin glutamine deamidase domain-containing protein n=1 Tax=Burkholderia sp. LMU1-1-1.1 TaxID=3135266 RepID=UPI003428E075